MVKINWKLVFSYIMLLIISPVFSSKTISKELKDRNLYLIAPSILQSGHLLPPQPLSQTVLLEGSFIHCCRSKSHPLYLTASSSLICEDGGFKKLTSIPFPLVTCWITPLLQIIQNRRMAVQPLFPVPALLWLLVVLAQWIGTI